MDVNSRERVRQPDFVVHHEGVADDSELRPGPTARWGDRDRRRGDILAAGEYLLEYGGYEGLRMRSVAARAGISLGAVYTYYSNKESLFAAVFAERVDRMAAALEVRLEAVDDFVDAFTVLTEEYRKGYLVFGRHFDALSSTADAATALDDKDAARLRDATTRIVLSLSENLRRFGYTGDIPLGTTLLWSAVTGLANHYTTARQQILSVQWNSAVRFTAETLGRGLGLERAVEN